MTSEENLAANTPTGCAAIEGEFDHSAQRVDLQTGAIVNDASMAEENRRLQEGQRRRDHAALRISELERRQLRPLRELQIDSTNTEARGRLEQIDAQIAALRGEL